VDFNGSGGVPIDVRVSVSNINTSVSTAGLMMGISVVGYSGSFFVSGPGLFDVVGGSGDYATHVYSLSIPPRTEVDLFAGQTFSIFSLTPFASFSGRIQVYKEACTPNSTSTRTSTIRFSTSTIRLLTTTRTSTTTTSVAPTGWYRNATPTGEGWMNLSWFGDFWVGWDPWVYHATHGWLYYFGSDPSLVWFWDDGMKMYWRMSESDYPYLYRSEDNCWLWYSMGTTAPRWFWNYCTSQWESW